MLGAWLPIDLLILPIALRMEQSIRLNLSLQSAKLLTPSGVWASCVSWLARLWLAFQRTPLQRLVARSLQEQARIETAGNDLWLTLDATPSFASALEIRKGILVLRDVPLSQFVQCVGILPEVEGVQFDMEAGPLLSGTKIVAEPILRGMG